MANAPIKMTPQNFSIPAGYNEVVTLDVDPDVTESFEGLNIVWRVYEQQFGIRTVGAIPIIGKASPADIEGIDSPLSIRVQLQTADTVNLLRNYYHEATITDGLGEVIGGSYGIMTVTATENRSQPG